MLCFCLFVFLSFCFFPTSKKNEVCKLNNNQMWISEKLFINGRNFVLAFENSVLAVIDKVNLGSLERGKMERQMPPDFCDLIKQDDDDETTFKAASAHSPAFQSPQAAAVSETPCSAYIPSNYSPLTEVEGNTEQNPRDLLNAFLAARDISPIRFQLATPWNEAAERTKRRHARKAKQVVFAALEEIAPGSPEMLLNSLQSSGEEDEGVDKSLMDALVECFNNASHWSARRQILSIMADKAFSALKKLIPGLIRYRFNVACQHTLLHGRGSPVAITKGARIRVSMKKLDHFLSFITSGQVIQDLPFGERTLKLSGNTEVTIPNVVRTLIP